MSDKPSPKMIRQTRDKAPRSSDWERMKPLITFLYYNMNMTLGQVMTEMREKHKFCAGKTNYKDHLDRWNIKKYSKAAEKQAALDMGNNPLSNPNLIATTSIPPHRLVRYVKDCQRRERQALKTELLHKPELSIDESVDPSFSHPFGDTIDSTENTINSTRDVNDQYVHSIITNGSFLYSPADRPPELFFKRFRNYLQSCFQNATSHCLDSTINMHATTPYDPPPSYYHLVDCLSLVFHADAVKDIDTACQWLHEACEIAKDALKQAHWRLIAIFKEVCILHKQNATLGCVIAQFLAKMAVEVYRDSQHCVVQLFNLFLQLYQQTFFLERVGQIALASIRDIAPKDSKALALVHSDVAEFYQGTGLLDAALHIAERNHRYCSTEFGPSNYHTRMALHGLAVAYYDCGEFAKSYRAAQTLLRLGAKATMCDEAYMGACIVLGDFYLELGMMNDAKLVFELLFPLAAWEFSSATRDFYWLQKFDYAARMIYNIKQAETRVLETSELPTNDTASPSVPSQHADMLFEKCRRNHGW